jgi:hypothetical protein
MHSASVPLLEPIASSAHNADTSGARNNAKLRHDNTTVPFTPNLMELARQLWMVLDTELRASGLAIVYGDVCELAAFNNPPEALSKIVGYMCLLLGLQPTWQAAKSSLFREMRSFLNFLREVSSRWIMFEANYFTYLLISNCLFYSDRASDSPVAAHQEGFEI